VTDTEWLASPDPDCLLASLGSRLSERKLRLFVCACSRRAWDLLGKGGRKAVRAAEAWADGHLDVATLQRVTATAQREEAAARQAADRKWWAATGVAPVLARLGALAAVLTDPDARGPRDTAAALAIRSLEPCAPDRLLYLTGVGPDGVRFRHRPRAHGDPDKLEERQAVRRATAAVQDAWWTERQAQADLLRCLIRGGEPAEFQSRWRTIDAVGLARSIFDEAAFERLPILADALMDAGCADERVIGHCRSGGPHTRGCWVVDLVLGLE